MKRCSGQQLTRVSPPGLGAWIQGDVLGAAWHRVLAEVSSGLPSLPFSVCQELLRRSVCSLDLPVKWGSLTCWYKQVFFPPQTCFDHEKLEFLSNIVQRLNFPCPVTFDRLLKGVERPRLFSKLLSCKLRPERFVPEIHNLAHSRYLKIHLSLFPQSVFCYLSAGCDLRQ